MVAQNARAKIGNQSADPTTGGNITSVSTAACAGHRRNKEVACITVNKMTKRQKAKSVISAMQLKHPKAAARELSDAFDNDIEVEHTTHKGHPALLVRRAAMYQAPEYKGSGGLLGMLETLLRACGGNQVDQLREISRGGCETCDYGSLYGIEYVVWYE